MTDTIIVIVIVILFVVYRLSCLGRAGIRKLPIGHRPYWKLLAVIQGLDKGFLGVMLGFRLCIRGLSV